MAWAYWESLSSLPTPGNPTNRLAANSTTTVMATEAGFAVIAPTRDIALTAKPMAQPEMCPEICRVNMAGNGNISDRAARSIHDSALDRREHDHWSRELYPLHEMIHHLLLARLIERDGELVALDVDDVAVAEFLVEHAVADCVGRDGPSRFRYQFALDRCRAAQTGSRPIP